MGNLSNYNCVINLGKLSFENRKGREYANCNFELISDTKNEFKWQQLRKGKVTS